MTTLGLSQNVILSSDLGCQAVRRVPSTGASPNDGAPVAAALDAA